MNKLRLVSYSWKGNSTRWGDSYLVEPNCSGRHSITDFCCLPFRSAGELVTNIFEYMKWSDSKQLNTYTLARSFVLVPSLPLLTGSEVLSLLPQLPCRLACTENRSHCVIIASDKLKSNFKIETIFIRSSIYYWLPLCFPN